MFCYAPQIVALSGIYGLNILLLSLFLSRIQDDSWIIFLLIMAAIFWIYRLIKVFCNVLSYWEIRQFYIKALKIRMVRNVETLLR